MKNSVSSNILMQVGLVVFTGVGFALTAFKLPQYGLVSNLISQFFWLYSSYLAWRRADQVGIFIASVFITFILLGGVINYWLL
jgi:hypothetical protein